MTRPDLRFKPRLSVLNDDQVQSLHHAILEVLERTGIQVSHPRALALFDGAGAHVSGARVRIPAWLAEESIRRAPSRVALGDRNGRRCLFLEGNRTWFGPTVDTMDYLDPLTGERRPFVSDDCRITASIADALPNYSWVMTIGMAADAPPDIADRVIAKQVLTYCRKPMVFCSKDLDAVRAVYDMAVLIAGGEERFRLAPTIAPLTDPISPLLHYDPTVEKILFCAEKGVPLVHLSAPQAGSTAPATFAGTIVQGMAEALSGLILAQIVRPGAPVVFGAFTTIMDMSTTIFSYAAPETSLMVAAAAQMAQFYGLPFMGTGGCSDAKLPDPQAAAEAAFSCLSSALSGANLIHEPGQLDHGSLASPANIVLVHEVLDMVRQFMGGVPVNAETLALDVIDRVGPGNNFLQEEHTYEHFRDVWYSKLFDRSIYEQWQAGGATEFGERLRRRTQQIMAQEPPPLAPEISKELERMAASWA